MENTPLPENLNLFAIAGPTGSGKSGLALQLARRFAGEVVNCDSLQIYRFFNIGTAKLAEKDQRGIPHHLIDIANPDGVTLHSAGCKARSIAPSNTSAAPLAAAQNRTMPTTSAVQRWTTMRKFRMRLSS